MTIWTREQIQQARGIRAQAEIDHVHLARYGADDAFLASIKRKMFHSMQGVAHTFALELNEEDVHLIECPPNDEDPRSAHVVQYRTRWEPVTEEVEFLGGHDDGRRYRVSGAPHQPVRVAITPTPPPVWMDEGEVPASPEIVTLTCVGWNEQERHWVYGRA